jgi:hypothetical protein
MFYLAIIACALLRIAPAFAEPVESSPLIRLEASRAENIAGYSHNPSGVYPVRLRWQKPAADIEPAFHVYRSVRQGSGFERISAAPLENETGGLFIFIDENPGAVPGKPYYYRISFLNSKGEEAGFSETVMGYGALSHESFFREYMKTVESSHKKLTHMHKRGSMNKLGSERVQGAVSGSLSYQARIAGLGGRVIMQYENYADFYIDDSSALGPCFILSGNTNTSASMNQSGTMDGTVNVSGMYKGRIHYDKIQIRNGAAGGGTYGVEMEGFPRAELSWTSWNP